LQAYRGAVASDGGARGAEGLNNLITAARFALAEATTAPWALNRGITDAARHVAAAAD